MKFFLLAFFSLSLVNVAFAGEEKVSCYRPVAPYDQKFSSIKVLSINNQVSKVKIALANSNATIEDQNPVASDRRLAPVCHGTLSGRYLCTPWTTVTEFRNFEKGLVTSLYFSSLTYGVMSLQSEAQDIKLKEVSCF